jgi:hypothetical protein
MWLIILALAAGIAVGACRRLPPAWLAALPRLMTGTLFLLLFILGAQIGGNSQLMASLPLLGWRAAVISACTIGGSLAVLLLAARWYGLTAKEDE